MAAKKKADVQSVTISESFVVPDTPEARRTLLDETSARYENLSPEGKEFHDTLATLVAEDEKDLPVARRSTRYDDFS